MFNKSNSQRENAVVGIVNVVRLAPPLASIWHFKGAQRSIVRVIFTNLYVVFEWTCLCVRRAVLASYWRLTTT